MDMSEIKSLIEKQGEAFEAFKNSTAMELVELKKKGVVDPLTAERIEKIEKSLDAAVEGKAAIEAAIEAERKEREDFEARINRHGIKADNEDQAKRELELKEFNGILSAHSADRKRGNFDPLDEDDYVAYKAAREKEIRYGRDALDTQEVKTLSVGFDADGGYFVTPDTGGRIVRKVYESSPMRQVANVQTISSDKLEGIEDLAEAGAKYADEKATSGDTKTPDIGKWEIPVFWIDTEPKATQQILDDSSVDIEAWLTGKVSSRFARFENAEFVAGKKGKIRGMTSYPTAADDGSGVDWGKIGHVVSGANGAFAGSNPADKIFDLIGLVKNEYLLGAGFMTARKVITTIRKFKDGNGNYMWQPSLVAGQPEQLAGYPVTRAEDMPKLEAGSLSLAFGNFSEAYQIVDRQGIRVLRDAYTAKPYVKFYTTKRTGGGVINFEAIKFMKFST